MMKPSGKSSKSESKAPSDPLAKGFELLKGKLYKQAAEQFEIALETDRKLGSKLMQQFKTSLAAQDYESAIASGIALIKDPGVKSGFLIDLANCFRRVGDYPKSNDLLRNALRLNKQDKRALLNLAASIGKVDKYDNEISEVIDQFIGSEEYALPDYLNDRFLIENINRQLEEEREELSQKIQELIEEKETRTAEGDIDSVKELIFQIEKEERKYNEPKYEAVSKRIRNANKKNWARKTIDETKEVLQQNLFNLGLYAFTQNDFVKANDCFQKLKNEKNKIENLDLMIALVMNTEGKTQQAIDFLLPYLAKRPNNRLLNVNIGLFYKKLNNSLQSFRYLVKGASLLEQSDGLYNTDDISSRAEEYFEHGEQNKALALYKSVAEESPSAAAFIRVGELLLEKDELIEATMALREAQELEPKNKFAERKLIEIHDLYCLKAESFVRRGDYISAAVQYQSAIELHKSADVLLKAAEVHDKLEDWTKASSLRRQSDEIQSEIKMELLEGKRKIIIDEGKRLMKAKDFNGAIEKLEKAFEMKADRDTFLLLAHIFKGLNQKRRLSSLMSRWKLLMDREETKG